MRLLRTAILALVALAGGPVAAQSIPPSLGEVVGAPDRSPVLTLDQERLFEESAFGRRLAEEIDAASRALAAENREIEARLTEEERALTDLRPTLPPEEFAGRADAFDARVEEIRAEQDAKSRALTRRRERARREFFESALPVLSAMMRERGASVILDAQAIFLSFDSIDITDAALDRLDARADTEGRPAPPTDDPEAGQRAVPGGAAPDDAE